MKRILILALALSALPAFSQWTVGASAPEARSRPAGAIIGNDFFFLGGETTGGARNVTAWKYNVPTNTWSAIADLPNGGAGNGGVSNIGAAAVGSNIYLPGGYNGTAGLNRLAIYDSGANSWTTGANLPSAVYAHTVSALGTKVYVAGGSSTGAAGTGLLIYDTVAGTWSTGASMATARQYAASAAIDGKLYVAGGNTTNLTSVEIYDPATDTWSAGPAMGTGRGGGGLYNLLGNAYAVAGGWTTYLTSGELLSGGSWGAGDSVNIGARTFAYAGNNAWLVKAGGWSGAYLDGVEYYVVPEPGTLLVLGAGAALLRLRRRRN